MSTEPTSKARCEGLDPGDWPEADCGNHTPHPAHDRKRESLRELCATLTAEVNRLGTDLASTRAEVERGERDRIQLKNENSLLLAKLDRQRVDADLARRDLKRVSDWHSPSAHEDEAGLCGGCGGHWPCHTRQILDGYLNPAYMTARCGQLAVHAPHISDTGPDRPRNCPGTPVPSGGHTAGCVAGVACEPYCEAQP